MFHFMEYTKNGLQSIKGKINEKITFELVNINKKRSLTKI